MSEETIRFIVGDVSVNLRKKFKVDENGLWYNTRLEYESERRSSFTESRRLNGNKGGRPKKEKPIENLMVNHTDNRMENEIENTNEIVFGLKKESRISIKKVYAGDKVKIIYDLRAYFADRVEDFARAGWTAYDEFMTANPAAVFEDDNHLYNSYRKFCTTATKKSQHVKMDDL